MRAAVKSLVVVFLLAVPGVLHGQRLVPRLVRDIDTTSYAGSSRPRDLVAVPNGLAFTAFDRRELWLRDDREGSTDAVLRSDEIRPLSAYVYAARQADQRFDLYALATFRLGAYLVKLGGGPFVSIGPPISSSIGGPAGWLVDADDGSGRALFVLHDAQAVLIARPQPLPGGRLARSATGLGERALFVARAAGEGEAVWASDGTAAGTSPIFPGDGVVVGGVSIAGTLGDRALIVVSGTSGCAGAELWLTDGTAAGTAPIATLGASGGCARVTDVLIHLTRAYLVVDDGVNGKQLWSTDGTAAGTARLTDFAAADPFAGSPLRNVYWDGGLFFFADDGVHGREPWMSDGTVAGTRLLRDLCPGPCSTTGEPLERLFNDGDRLLFSASTPKLGRELWITDGTAAGTRLVVDSCPGACSGEPDDVYPSPNASSLDFFTAVAANGERANWQTDGTPAGTRRLTPPGVGVTRGASLGWAFAASDAVSGEELWRSDGSPQSTRLWFDIERERDSGSHPQMLGAVGNRLVFSAFDPEHGRGLWASDGSGAGTIRLPGPAPKALESVPSVSAGGRVYITGSDSRGTVALWSLTGQLGGNARLTAPGVEVRSFLRPVGERVFFLAKDAQHGEELWVTGGTRASTHLVADLTPGPGSSDLSVPGAAVLDGRLVFRRIESQGESWVSHVWISDGTVAGTKPVLEDYPYLTPLDGVGTYEIFVVEMNGRIYFGGLSEAYDDLLYVSDRTIAGTVPLVPGTIGPGSLLVAGDRLYAMLATRDPASGDSSTELWVSDGTTAGSVRLPISMPNEYPDIPQRRVGARGLLLSNAAHEIWYTDGTLAGTERVEDASGAPLSSGGRQLGDLDGRFVFGSTYEAGPCIFWEPGRATETDAGAPLCGDSFQRAGERLFFSGFTPRRGSELWSFELR